MSFCRERKERSVSTSAFRSPASSPISRIQYGDDDRLRHIPYHGEDAGGEARRGHAHIGGDLPHAGIDRIENTCEVAHDPADKKLFEPVCYCVKNTAKID
jgi:hypothetical protein